MSEEKDLKLPEPRGYKILIAIPKLDEKFQNSKILRADSHKKREETASIVGMVMEIGDLAYKDEDRFEEHGAGWRLYYHAAYSGTRF